MGGRTNLRWAQSKPPLGQGFRGFDRQRQTLGLHRLRAAAHQEISLPIEQPIRLRFGHLVSLAMVGGFFAGVAPALVAIVAGSVLLFTRRIKSQKVYAEIDWTLLLMFAGLVIFIAEL